MGVLKRFWKDESGATAIEYAMIVTLLTIAVVVAIRLTGVRISDNLTILTEHMV